MLEQLHSPIVSGEISIFPASNPNAIVYAAKNVIVSGVRNLFARLLVSNTEPVAGVWGLALGSGGTASNGWSAGAQPDPTASQIGMVSEILRKPLSSATYLDTNGNATATPTTTVAFLTTINATTDNLTVPCRELGLIGGGTTAGGSVTPMTTTPYFDPNNPSNNSVVLINYKTLPPFTFPQRTDFIVKWKLQF